MYTYWWRCFIEIILLTIYFATACMFVAVYKLHFVFPINIAPDKNEQWCFMWEKTEMHRSQAACKVMYLGRSILRMIFMIVSFHGLSSCHTLFYMLLSGNKDSQVIITKVDSNVWVLVSMVEELRMNSKTMRTGWNSGSHRIYVWKYSFGILPWFEMDVRTLKLDLGIFTCKWEFKLFGNWGRSSKKTERIETWATLLGRVKLTKRIPA